MKNNQGYFMYDYYCLRMPAQSVDSIFELNKEIDNTDLENHTLVIDLIEKIFSNPLFHEAIYVSSPEFYYRFLEIKNKNYPNKEEIKRLLISFYKYFSRMSHRCTPYGIFAGLSAGTTVKETTNIAFGKEKYRPVFQFNIQTISELLRQFNATDPSLIDTLKYYVNNTLYVIKDKMFFVEKVDKNGLQISNLSSITLNEYIQGILDCAKNGATVNEMVLSMSILDIDRNQKVGFINSLINSQVLISELLPSVSSNDFMADFLEKTKLKSISNYQIDDLSAIHQLFKKTNKIEEIKTVRAFFEKQDENSISNKKDFFRTDLFYNMQSNYIKRSVLKRISDLSYELMSIVPSTPSSSNLERFVQSFHKKYEEREVPLVQVIDPNYGVGYGLVVSGVAEYTPLIDGIPIASLPDNKISIDKKIEMIRRKAKRKYFENKQKVFKIDDDIKNWIEEIKDQNTEFENRTMTSAYIFGSILAESVEALDQGDFKFRPTQSHAPYAGRLLSRFLHGDILLDEKMKDTARIEQEANPDAIIAEVLYVPDGKYANISLCTPLRDYEIVYSSSSNLPATHQIDINDLVVSIRNGRVVLRSVRLNKEIIPYITNTYDAGFGTPIYQFLASVGYQNINYGFDWDWGALNHAEPFLPRIEYKNIILQRARWFLKKEKINYKDDSVLKEYFKKYKEEFHVSRYLVISDGDNELFIDLENEICRYILAKEINRKDVILFEFLRTPDQCFIKENGKSFTNEVTIPLGTDKPMYRRNYNDSDVVVKDEVQRVFSPGSEWLFIKIYSGTKVLDDILTNVIGPFSEQLIENQIIDKWFFIRYDDPDYHLRVRFHRSDKKDNTEWNSILDKLQKKLDAFVKEDHAVTVMVDTYKRELERYGAETMESSESIFNADSVAIYKFICLIYGNEGEELRWKFGLVSIDALLNDFGYTTLEKKQLLKNLSADFFHEFTQHSEDKGKLVSKALKDRYRNYKIDIAKIMSVEGKDPELSEAYDCFDERSEKIKREVLMMKNISPEFRNGIMASYIHMTMNRLFIVNQRKHELVIYYFLSKYYESVIAQQKNKSYEYASRS